MNFIFKKTQKAPEVLPFISSIVRNKKGQVEEVAFKFDDCLERIGKITPEIELTDKKVCKSIEFDGG